MPMYHAGSPLLWCAGHVSTLLGPKGPFKLAELANEYGAFAQ